MSDRKFTEDEVQRYARRQMKAPETLSLSRDSISVAEIHHAYYIVSGIARSRDLLKILFAEEPESAIIFCNTKAETETVARHLSAAGFNADWLNGDLPQRDRPIEPDDRRRGDRQEQVVQHHHLDPVGQVPRFRLGVARRDRGLELVLAGPAHRGCAFQQRDG